MSNSGLTFRLLDDGTYEVSGQNATGRVVIPSHYEGVPVTAIAQKGFHNNIKIFSLHIEQGITTIKKSAFLGCSKLIYAYVPQSVTTIENWAFRCCSSLTKIDFCDGLKFLGDDVFMSSGIKEIVLPSTVDFSDGNCKTTFTSKKTIKLKIRGLKQKPENWSDKWNFNLWDGKCLPVAWDYQDSIGISPEIESKIELAIEKYNISISKPLVAKTNELVLRNLKFKVSNAAISAQSQDERSLVVFVEVYTKEKEYDDETWAPSLSIEDGFVVPVKTLDEAVEKSVVWQASEQDIENRLGGVMQIFEFDELSGSKIEFLSKEKENKIKLRWSGLANPRWNSEYGEDVPFVCEFIATVK